MMELLELTYRKPIPSRKFKIGDKVQSIFSNRSTGIITHFVDRQLGVDAYVRGDNGRVWFHHINNLVKMS